MKVPTAILTLIIGIIITIASLWVSQNNGLMPIAAAAEATEIDQLFAAMMAIATGLFLLVQGALIYSFFAFQRRADDQTDAIPVHGNVSLEIVWTAIPAMLVLWLAIYSFDVYQSIDSVGTMGSNHMAHQHAQPPEVQMVVSEADGATMDSSTAQLPSQGQLPWQTNPPPGPAMPQVDPLVVKVDGLQYAWLFTYPDTGIIAGELHLPINRPVTLDISARDVIHAFWVPEFRLKQDAVPGQETHLNFQPTRAGTYSVICAELCGAYHGAMKTRAIVHSEADYQAWVESQVVANQDSPTLALDPSSSAGPSRLQAQAMAHHLPTVVSDLPPVRTDHNLAPVTPRDHTALSTKIAVQPSAAEPI